MNYERAKRHRDAARLWVSYYEAIMRYSKQGTEGHRQAVLRQGPIAMAALRAVVATRPAEERQA